MRCARSASTLDEGQFVVLLGPVGLRQVDAAQHPRRPRRADERPGALPRHRPDARRRGGAHRLPAPARRLRVPVLQPDSQPDGARERRARHRDLRAARCRRTRRCGWSTSTPRRDHFPGAALGRRAAARGDRARHRQASGGAAVRRADRRARHLHRHRRARGAGAGQRASSARRRSSSPTTPRSPRWPTGSSAWPTAASPPSRSGPTKLAPQRAVLVRRDARSRRSTASCCATCWR